MKLWRLPKYLIITLKRFQATKASDSLALMNSDDPTIKFMMMNSRFSSLLQNRVVYNKLNTLVQFPLKDLDMSKYVVGANQSENKKYVYDLCAVVNHLGQSLSLGHYTAFARTHHKADTTQDELGWRLFDDQSVMQVKNSSQIVSKDAYVLMYRIRNKNETAQIKENESESLNEPIGGAIGGLGVNANAQSESDEEENVEEYYDIESEESEEIEEDQAQAAPKANFFTNLNDID